MTQMPNRPSKTYEFHGYTDHPLYQIWNSMKGRCYCPSTSGYKNYGKRGVFVCKSWYHSAKVFIAWSLVNGWKPGLTLDRINNDGHYTPGNCRYVTRQVNNLNQRKRKDNTLGIVGLVMKRGKFYGQVQRRRKRHYTKVYLHSADAINALINLRRKLDDDTGSEVS